MNSNHWRAISVLQIAPPLATLSDLIDVLVTPALPQHLHAFTVRRTNFTFWPCRRAPAHALVFHLIKFAQRPPASFGRYPLFGGTQCASTCKLALCGSGDTAGPIAFATAGPHQTHERLFLDQHGRAKIFHCFACPATRVVDYGSAFAASSAESINFVFLQHRP
jgi:hypothetical protein